MGFPQAPAAGPGAVPGRVTVRCRRGLWLVLAPVLAAALPPGTAAGQAQPGYGIVPTASEGREMRATIARLSARYGVAVSTLNAIAGRLGRSAANTSFGVLIQLVGEQAEQASVLQGELARLRTQVATLQDDRLRTAASAALARGTAAFREGRLEEADAAFAELQQLRLDDTSEGLETWLQATATRSQLAELRLDFDAADSLLHEARMQARALRDRVTLADWQLSLLAGGAQYNRGRLFDDRAAIDRAIEIYQRDALPLAARETQPHRWAETQHQLGMALKLRGDAASLAAAEDAYRKALHVRTRAAMPARWAVTTNNLANVLRARGEAERRPELIQDALDLHAIVLVARPRASDPLDWGRSMHNVGSARRSLAGLKNDDAKLLGEAIDAFRQALEVRTRDVAPEQWVMSQKGLADALARLAEQRGDGAMMDEALAAADLVLTVDTQERSPPGWASTQTLRGNLLQGLALVRQDPSLFGASLAAYDLAVRVWTRERDPMNWSLVRENVGNTLAFRARVTGNCRDAAAARTAYREALAVFVDKAMAENQAKLDRGLARLDAIEQGQCADKSR
jgi:tetratricopeptide (TPR) repeat protein